MMRQRRKKPGNISAWRAKKLDYVALRRQLVRGTSGADRAERKGQK